MCKLRKTERIRVEGLSFSYHRPILNDITLSLFGGEMTALLGINGAGKSTFLKCLNGFLRPREGSVFLAGTPLKRLNPAERAKILSYVAQTSTPAYCTVYDAVLVGRKPHLEKTVSDEDHRVVTEILEELKLSDFALRNVSELSGGEYQKTVLARALAQDPEFLLLDEPTSNMDMKNQIEVLQILKHICRKRGIGILVSIHDVNLALRYAERFLLMKDGGIYADGGREVISAESVEAVYGVKSVVHYWEGDAFIVPARSDAGEIAPEANQ